MDSISSRYRRVGAWLWMATLIQIVGQAVVAAAWPEPYSITRNAISDLGVVTCGPFDENGAQVRWVCSPWHGVFNASMVVTGVFLAVGAVLMAGAFPRRRTGRAAMIMIVVAGVLVALVGVAPWDVYPAEHDFLATGQALVQWLAMILLAVACRPRGGRPRDGRHWLGLRIATVITLLVSVIGSVIFVAGLDGVVVPGVPWGIAERLGFDTLTVWGIVVGSVVLHDLRRHPV